MIQLKESKAADPGREFRAAAAASASKPDFAERIPLMRFSRLYRVVWELVSLQIEVRRHIPELSAEYKKRMPHTKLILHAKRQRPGGPYGGLYWAYLSPAPRKMAGGFGGTDKYWVHHLPGPFTDEAVNEWGSASSRAAYWDFDRRRLALTKARRGLSKALSLIHSRLKAACRRLGEPAVPAPLPPEEVMQELPRPEREALERGWKLLLGLAELEVRLESLSRESESELGAVEPPTVPGKRKSYTGAYFDFSPDVTGEKVGDSQWRVPHSPVPILLVKHRVLRRKYLPPKLRPRAAELEKARKKTLREYRFHASTLAKILKISGPVPRETRLLLAESGLCLTDGFGMGFSRGG